MQGQRTAYRIVIGSYAEAWRLWRAAQDLFRNGLSDPQLCAIATADTLSAQPPADVMMADYPDCWSVMSFVNRQFGDRSYGISSMRLFDLLWRSTPGADHPIADWMTPAQAKTLWDGLLSGDLLLVANAATADQQQRCSRTQLRHRPLRVLTYNFVM